MRIRYALAILFIFSICLVPPSHAQDSRDDLLRQIKWQRGPCISALGNEAEIRIPAGYVFANPDDARKLMEAVHNIPSPTNVGFVAPTTLRWFLLFDFADSGYIKDDEKTSLNADAMLKSIQSANEAANEEKKKRGWDTFDLTGWQLAPRYNEETHNLEWATKFLAKGVVTVNWNTRLLGRDGVMSVTLVATEDTIQDILPQFNDLLKGFSYTPGHRYSEFRQGDKMAAYGLSALVIGGAAAAAAKAGLFKYLGKFIMVIFVAVAAFFKNLWAKITNKKKEQ